MKTFKELLEAPGAPARDNQVNKDDPEEVKGYKPRSKGEEDFANAHMISKIDHPVATDAQFTGNVDRGNPDDHVGGKVHAPGEKMTKQGSSDVKASGKEFKDPKQYGVGGEKNPVMQGSSRVRESFSAFVQEIEDGND